VQNEIMNLKVIAEGAETNEQLNLLKELKCNIAQGFLFSKPVEAEKITKILLNEAKLSSSIK